MSFKEKIIQRVLKEEKEKFLTKLIQDPGASLKVVLTQYGISFEEKGNTFVIPVTDDEEIIISVKKQRRQ